jgi:hypothetical protein
MGLIELAKHRGHDVPDAQLATIALYHGHAQALGVPLGGDFAEEEPVAYRAGADPDFANRLFAHIAPKPQARAPEKAPEEPKEKKEPAPARAESAADLAKRLTEHRGSGTASDAAAVSAELGKMPSKVLQTLRNKNIPVIACKQSITTS